MGSVRGRLSVGLLASLLLVFVLQWAVVGLSIQRVTENYVASRLEHEIESLLAAIDLAADGAVRLTADPFTPIYERPFSGHYFRIDGGGATLRSRSLWDTDLAVPALPPGERQRLHAAGPEDQPLLVLVEGFRKQGVGFTVAVAEDLSDIHADIGRFQWRYALLSAAFLVVLVALAGVVLRRGLAPLDDARDSIARLQQGETTQLDENTPVEIRPLVREINRLLELTRQRLQRSRTATGNLAHALKAPLSTIGRLREEPALAAHPELRAQLDRQVQTMAHLVDRELKRARLSGAAAPGARFVPAREIPELVDALRRIHAERGLAIETQVAPESTFRGDREDMLELFGNLLDNACKWARSRVRLRIESSPGLRFSVEDDGPGVAAPALTTLTRRGTRLDESREGHGLGLAIVSDIVAQYDGHLSFDRAPELGGLRVQVELPPPD